MRRILVLSLSTIFLLLLLALPSTTLFAASAPCTATPDSGPVGTVFTITCSGFVPGEQTNAWMTEPDGATFSWSAPFGGPFATGKANGAGIVTYGFPTGSQNEKRSLGDWAMTVKGSTVIGIARFTVTGSGEGVSGAVLTNNDGIIIGTGFAPFEIVTVWVDYPNGDCSANWWAGPGFSTVTYGNFKTDASGSFKFLFAWNPIWNCTGTYHIVARGNTSHLGGETWWTTPNYPETETASLVATPDAVVSLGGLISFSGVGYAPNEIVTCWQTTPQGGVLPEANYKADNLGHIAFRYHTGADYGIVVPSQGALGEWAETCRGNQSGATGIARFVVFGGAVDP
jgi:hypothetical protein